MAASIPFRSLIPLIVLVVLASGTPAFAAEKAPPRPSGAASRSDAILTPEQVRECENRKERLRAQTDDALKDKAAIDAEQAEIARTGTRLDEELATLDRANEAAVDAHNDKVRQRNQQIDGFQSRAAAYNAKAEAVKSTKEGYEKSCGNRRYDERDLNDLKRKK